MHSHRLTHHIAILLLTALAVSSCDLREEYEKALSEVLVDHYINFTISVEGGSNRVTRAPLGGEDGDGRETGLDRENTVAGITLILYKDGGTVIDFIGYYPVTSTDGTNYTTGNRLIENDAIDFSEKYRAIVIANSFMLGQFKKGDLISTVRDYGFSHDNLYAGAKGSETNFVMTGESAAVLDFTETRKPEEKSVVYELKDAIGIQRLAARIDFDTSGSTFSETDKKGGAYDKPGYKYSVGTSDVFVVERITPFNLYNETEYLLRHDGTGEYADYILDPKTTAKSTATNYLSPIAADMTTSGYGIDFSTDMKMADGNVILTYAMENTLLQGEKIYGYATGLAIHGTFYQGNDVSKTKIKKVFYGFLRHTEESASAEPYHIVDFASLDVDKTSEVKMNYGIVRNNIYRVSIEKIDPIKGKMKLKTAIHDWMKVKHPDIFS